MLQDQMAKETSKVEDLEHSLSACKKELCVILKQAEHEKENSESDIISQRTEVHTIHN